MVHKLYARGENDVSLHFEQVFSYEIPPSDRNGTVLGVAYDPKHGDVLITSLTQEPPHTVETPAWNGRHTRHRSFVVQDAILGCPSLIRGGALGVLI